MAGAGASTTFHVSSDCGGGGRKRGPGHGRPGVGGLTSREVAVQGLALGRSTTAMTNQVQPPMRCAFYGLRWQPPRTTRRPRDGALLQALRRRRPEACALHTQKRRSRRGQRSERHDPATRTARVVGQYPKPWRAPPPSLSCLPPTPIVRLPLRPGRTALTIRPASPMKRMVAMPRRSPTYARAARCAILTRPSFCFSPAALLAAAPPSPAAAGAGAAGGSARGAIGLTGGG